MMGEPVYDVLNEAAESRRKSMRDKIKQMHYHQAEAARLNGEIDALALEIAQFETANDDFVMELMR
jgi:prefoldin subunit 5